MQVKSPRMLATLFLLKTKNNSHLVSQNNIKSAKSGTELHQIFIYREKAEI
jgi:hypothetical protein